MITRWGVKYNKDWIVFESLSSTFIILKKSIVAISVYNDELHIDTVKNEYTFTVSDIDQVLKELAISLYEEEEEEPCATSASAQSQTEHTRRHNNDHTNL